MNDLDDLSGSSSEIDNINENLLTQLSNDTFNFGTDLLNIVQDESGLTLAIEEPVLEEPAPAPGPGPKTIFIKTNGENIEIPIEVGSQNSWGSNR